MIPDDSRPIWPFRLAAREGASTARAGRWTSLLIVIALAWCVAAAGAADAVAVSRLLAGERAWIDAGGHVLVVTGARTDAGANPVPAGTCDRLTQIDGIDAAFALRVDTARGAFAHIPAGRVPLFEVSPGASRFLGASSAAGASVIVTTTLAQRTGVHDGDIVEVVRTEGLLATETAGPLTVEVANSALMGEEYDGALLVPTNLLADADACFVSADAAHLDAVSIALPALLAHAGQPAIVQPRLFSSEFTVDYSHAFEDRSFRWLWMPAAAVLALIWVMTQWLRRSQLAIYSTFGMRVASRLVMQTAEWAVLVAYGLPWGWGLGVVWALGLGATPGSALGLVSFQAVLTVLAASVVVVLFGLRPTGTLLDTLKDR